jgi:hypothetical protein
MANEVVIREQGGAVALPDEMSVEQVVAQAEKIQQLMKLAMKEGEHYGVIPGTERKNAAGQDISKPTLLKSGAEKLCFMFRLAPSYQIIKTREGRYLDVDSTCTLTHIPSGRIYGSGMGSCTTRESKYAYRKAERSCPTCGKYTIIKGLAQYGGGWVCWKRKGGCGAQFKDGNIAIEGQQVGRMDNPDIADTENTVLKMSNKRSLIAACLVVLAVSDLFTQDLEDLAAIREELAAEAVETARAAESGTPAESSAQQGATAENGRGRRLKVKPDQGGSASASAAEAPKGGRTPTTFQDGVPVAGGAPTPPPGESIVMVDAAAADAQLDRATKLGVVIDGVLRSIGVTRQSKGEGPAPTSLRDLTLAESEWLNRVLTQREKQAGGM